TWMTVGVVPRAAAVSSASVVTMTVGPPSPPMVPPITVAQPMSWLGGGGTSQPASGVGAASGPGGVASGGAASGGARLGGMASPLAPGGPPPGPGEPPPGDTPSEPPHALARAIVPASNQRLVVGSAFCSIVQGVDTQLVPRKHLLIRSRHRHLDQE